MAARGIMQSIGEGSFQSPSGTEVLEIGFDMLFFESSGRRVGDRVFIQVATGATQLQIRMAMTQAAIDKAAEYGIDLAANEIFLIDFQRGL